MKNHITFILVIIFIIITLGAAAYPQEYPLNKKVRVAVFIDNQWIDPVAEESISAGDSDGMYYPTTEVKRRILYYLSLPVSKRAAEVSPFIEYVGKYVSPTLLKEKVK